MDINNTPTSTDVVIVGAGPTGLMAALLLQHSGIKVRILDKNTQQAHESRAFVLHARSLELLESIGIVDKFLVRGVIAPGVQLFVNGHKAAEINLDDIGADDTPYTFILMLPQSEIEKILIAELERRGILVEYHTEVTAFEQNDEGVVVRAITVEGKQYSISAAYLIGADGAHSVVRKNLGLVFAGAAYPENFMLADCRIDWPLEYARVKLFLRGKSLGAYLPLKGQSLGRIIVIDAGAKKYSDTIAAQQATTAEPLALAEVETAFQAATGFPVKLSDPVWVTRYRIHHREVGQFNVGRVFLAGDAGHIHSPAGGQGMNTGLQDAANLAWKLALLIKGHGSKALLDTYNAERWPVGQKLLHFTDNAFGKMSSQHRITAELRNILAPLIIKSISKIRCLRMKMFRFVSELGIRYHENAFIFDAVTTKPRGIAKKVTAGHRVPNALYKRNHDVFGLIDGYQFHVLALVKKSLSVEEIEQIVAELALLPKNLGLPLTTHFIGHSLTGEHSKFIQAESNQVFANYGLSNENPFGLFLIRPDGYIAYRADEMNVAGLKRFCELF